MAKTAQNTTSHNNKASREAAGNQHHLIKTSHKLANINREIIFFMEVKNCEEAKIKYYLRVGRGKKSRGKNFVLFSRYGIYQA